MLQQSAGNRAVTALLVEGDRSRNAALLRQPVAAAPAAPPPPAAYRVVKQGFEVVPGGQLATKLGLPPDTVPPGAEANPEFVGSLFAPGASMMRLDELHGVPEAVVESLPEGEIVEMPSLTKTLAAGEGAEKGVEKLAQAGDEAAEAIERSMYFRVGGKVFKVVSLAYGAYRIAKAPREEQPKIAGEEVGRMAGEAEGAEGMIELCLALAPETEGASLLVCGVAGALGGEWAGEKAGRALLAPIVDVILNILEAPKNVAEGLAELGRLLSQASAVMGDLLGAPARVIAGSITVMHQKMAVDNWDLRGLPPALQADIRSAGNQAWRAFANLAPNPFVARLSEPLSAFGVPADVAARIAAALSAVQHAPGDAPGAYTGEAVLAMRPLDFVGAMQGLGLAFVQDPTYSAGFSGRWDDEAQLHLRLEPLVEDRAKVNPGNWDLSRVPYVNLGDGREVDLGPAIQAGGEVAWTHLVNLHEEELEVELRQPMGSLGLSRQAATDLADAINGLTAARIITLDADVLLECSPTSFVDLLPQFGVPFAFIKEPSEVAALTIDWVRKGFAPW